MPVISLLDLNKEQEILRFVRRPVRLHLLFKATSHRAESLFSRFDDDGDFVIIVYLSSGIVRGAFLKKPLEENVNDAFLIDLASSVSRIYPKCGPNSKVLSITLNLLEIAFGKSLRIARNGGTLSVYFSSCEVFRTNWTNVSGVIPGSNVKDVELYRLQGEMKIRPNCLFCQFAHVTPIYCDTYILALFFVLL